MRQTRTITDLNAKFQKRVQKLVEEYDHQQLQAQTFADYMVAMNMSYEKEHSRICGR